jgi:hypothetical protein
MVKNSSSSSVDFFANDFPVAPNLATENLSVRDTIPNPSLSARVKHRLPDPFQKDSSAKRATLRVIAALTTNRNDEYHEHENACCTE